MYINNQVIITMFIKQQTETNSTIVKINLRIPNKYIAAFSVCYLKQCFNIVHSCANVTLCE